VLAAQLFQFADLVGIHARQARDRQLLGFSFLSFPGLLEGTTERCGEFGAAGLENVVAWPAPEFLDGDFFADRLKDEDNRSIGTQTLGYRQSSVSIELRLEHAADYYVWNKELQLPREIFGCGDPSRFTCYSSTEQAMKLRIRVRLEVVNDQDLMHLRSS